ncbi:MAG: methyltransferase domain-containing protein [Candidatus Omnitrophota bacterium]|jgi:predicted O-methyltransferase YrrM|nr:MAG: methyltransferase domain-containing protein [Candidatus Omnitrophota bacterium]
MMNECKHPFQDPIDAIAGGYRACQVLLTANRLGVFAAIGKGKVRVERLVELLETDRRATRILCDALVALALLEKEEDSYRNSPLALEYLLPDSPNPRNGILWHGAKLYERWGKLHDAVKSGKPVPDEAIDPNLVGNEKTFAQAMADIGRTSAGQLAKLLDLSDVKILLDVGGGPGIYAIEFARQNPDLHAVIFDNEKTTPVALENAKQAGVADRVTAKAGDIFRDSIGGEYDFILISNVVHIYSYEQNAELVAKCANALAQGGRLCIKDFLLDPDRTGPAWGALFAVNMLVSTDQGDCHTVEEARCWLESAGLHCDSHMDLTAQSRLLIGKKD